MKNSKIYCKYIIQFNSIQFNSIQFNSIPKIVSLITLLFLLLFSIGCSSNEAPEPKYLELSGTWMRKWTFGDTYSDLSIDNNGNITLVSVLQVKPATDKKWSYAGKIEDNFEYPYTVKLTQTAFYFDYKIWTGDYENGKTGTITFSNASNCVVIVRLYKSDNPSDIHTKNFKKN